MVSEMLKNLEQHLEENIKNSKIKTKLLREISKIKNIYDKNNVFSTFVRIYSLKIKNNKYYKKGLIEQEQTIYMNNSLENIVEELKNCWLIASNDYQKVVARKLALCFKKYVVKKYAKIESRIEETSAGKQENHLLGMALDRFLETKNKADEYYNNSKWNEAYINYLQSKLLLLEIIRLLK
jgi:hypothetical protein